MDKKKLMQQTNKDLGHLPDCKLYSRFYSRTRVLQKTELFWLTLSSNYTSMTPSSIMGTNNVFRQLMFYYKAYIYLYLYAFVHLFFLLLEDLPRSLTRMMELSCSCVKDYLCGLCPNCITATLTERIKPIGQERSPSYIQPKMGLQTTIYIYWRQWFQIIRLNILWTMT